MLDTRPQKKSLTIAGHRTSISLEPLFWDALAKLSEEKNTTISALVSEIDGERGDIGLSSAIRVHLFRYYKAKSGSHNAT